MNASGHFADLLMVLDSFKRGDYWAGVGRLIATLNSFINGPTSGGPVGPVLAAGPGGVSASRFSAGGSPSPQDWDSVLDELEWMGEGVEGQSGLVSAPNPDPSRVDSVAAGFSGAALFALIKLAIEIFGQFRSKSTAATEDTDEVVVPGLAKTSKPAEKTPVTVSGGNKTAPSPEKAPTLPASTGGK